MSKLERKTFEFSRAREYFELKELSTLTGQEPETFAAVVLKELVDNALDGCEMAGVAPYITVEVDGDIAVDREIRMSVTDNGGGIPPEVVAKVLDYNIRVSDKSAYRSPTRGAQGNALKAVVGIPHALGGREPIVIEGRGVHHEIRPWIDPAGAVRIEHEESPSSLTEGTRVTVALPVGKQFFDPLHWVRSFALFNPHATLIYHTVNARVRKSPILTNPPETGSKSITRASPRARTGTLTRTWRPSSSPTWETQKTAGAMYRSVSSCGSSRDSRQQRRPKRSPQRSPTSSTSRTLRTTSRTYRSCSRACRTPRRLRATRP
jgi:hypothetical protein